MDDVASSLVQATTGEPICTVLHRTAAIVAATSRSGTFTSTTGSVGTTGFGIRFDSVVTIQHVGNTCCVRRIGRMARVVVGDGIG